MCNYLYRNIKHCRVHPLFSKIQKQLQFKKDISCNCKNVLKLLTLREGFYNKIVVPNNELAETIVCVREIYSS